LLTPLFNGSDMPTKIPRYKGRNFTGAWEQFRLDALHAATNNSHGYQQKVNPTSLGASPSL